MRDRDAEERTDHREERSDVNGRSLEYDQLSLIPGYYGRRWGKRLWYLLHFGAIIYQSITVGHRADGIHFYYLGDVYDFRYA